MSLKFKSMHCYCYCRWVMRGMRDRAHQVCDPSSKPKELQHLDEVVQANGYITANTLKQVLMQVKSWLPEEKKKGIVYQVPCKNCDGVQKNTEGPTDRTQACSGEKRRQQRYCSACGQEWTQYWLGKCESGEVSEGILGNKSHWSHQNQILQELHELGQWPTPLSHLETHPGPNLEINNNACF